MLKKIDFFYIFILITCFWVIVYLKSPHVFSWKFDPNLINLYKRSQDITHEVEGRVHLSDNDVYIATGYLYANGEDPTKYNFQHPPLIKYLFGVSTILTGNPYLVQLLFSAFYIFLTYLLGLKMFKVRKIAVLSTIFLASDPLLRSVTSEALLDLGQATFSLGYLISTLFYPSGLILQGLLLGLFSASKFWSTALLFFFFIYGYKKFVIKEKLNYKNIFYILVIAALTFSLTYFRSFINLGGKFNIVFFQLKILKYMIQHNSAPILGGQILLFLTGYFFKWWDEIKIVKSDIFNLLWPVSFVSGFLVLKEGLRKGLPGIIFLLPIVYFFFTITQVPFTRYFLLVLPYLYISLSYLIWKFFNKNKSKKIFWV
ncbi:MAG: hypothetical protein UT72_C0002G0001 [Candidatus Woesebacteria bacterium GW2011_GWB1_40_101]|uniref:Glycosyltransferase RgtA/B/C/D-like domain-containing protein n=1 Tax=Candidatus Woesebacteria bacterium GW2011_GWB1_40_101 TaxID=1618575 RepID=A0A0G0TPI1_9BACT|nr:MAG: hypothetical protein UT72_C0002G0001 [Candidatus Woesebacteria bacterium GW2011_GWB1_40_101]